jgi:hypothetical protein
MTGERARRRAWAGKWIAAVGLLHFAAGFLLYADAWRIIAGRGVVASINDHDATGTAFWFAAAGPLLMILGALVDWVERSELATPRWLGWALLALLVMLIVPMPTTGAWLLVPPALALLLRRQH